MKKNIKVVSLFSGCGGLDLGFKQAGFEIVWANDILGDAVETYKRHIGKEIVCGDINEMRKLIPDADIIIGGPPCQSFSLVGKRLKDDERGELVFTYLDIIKEKKPKVFLMENVPGLLSSKYNGEKLYVFLMREYEKIGYKVQIIKVDASDYFVPQRRKRIFLLGNRLGMKEIHIPKGEEYSKILFGKKIKSPITVKDALEDLPNPKAENTVNKTNKYIRKPKSVFSKIIRNGNKSVDLHILPTMSEKDKAFVKHIPPGGNYMNIPDSISTGRILKFKKTGGRTTTYGRLHPDRPAYTINTYFNRPNVGANYHYKEERLITPREALRLQSFPDNFTPYFKSKRNLHIQIGNAVPPFVSRAFAEGIKAII